MQSPPVPRYLVPPRSKYSPQHLILKHPQPPFNDTHEEIENRLNLGNSRCQSFHNLLPCRLLYENVTNKAHRIPLCLFFCVGETLFLRKEITGCVSQMKHQLDATLCSFYFRRVTLHISGASAHHQEYLKIVRRPLVHLLSLQVSHHISLLGPELPALIRRCDDLPASKYKSNETPT